LSGNVMNDNVTDQEYLFEDEYVFVTAEGKLFQKDNKYFKGRELDTVEQEKIQQKVEELRDSFKALEKKKKALFEEIEKSEDASAESTLEKLDAFVDEISATDAVGDFETLLDDIDAKKNALQTMEEFEQDSEASEFEKSEDLGDTREDVSSVALDGQQESSAEAGSETEDSDESESDEAETEEKVQTDSDTTSEKTEEPIKEESAEETVETTEESNEVVAFYKELLEKAESIAKMSDWSYVSMELDNLSHRWLEGPDYEGEDFQDEVKQLFHKLEEIKKNFEERKRKHYEKLNRQKEENLQKKKDLLERMQSIVNEEQWQAQSEVGKIRGKWDNINMLPADKGEGLDEKFQKLVDEFEEHKVDYLVQKAQQEEDNLAGKLLVLDKMEQLAKSIDSKDQDWKDLHKQFKNLTRQWKKIGRVPKDKSHQVWERYKNAQDEYYDRKYEYDDIFRKKIDKYLSKKKKLISEAEALLEQEDLAEAAREINRLHRRWKKAGNLPQKKENELWKRFKAATDAFNQKKSENIDLLRDQEEENYQEKLGLIETANEVKETTDWKSGHDKMQSLMKKWKEIGPVPKKKSRKIWKKFKKAMDYFYDRRREHFKEVHEEQEKNLEEKKRILEKLRELGNHEDPIEAVNQAKPLQEEFKNVGYVPIKQKNKIWKQYRKACDVIYDRFRAAKSNRRDDTDLSAKGVDPETRAEIRKKQKEYGRIKKEISRLEEDVMQFKDAKTYFKPSKKGNALRDEIQDKIDKAEDELQKKQDKLDAISDEIEDLKNEGEE